MAPHEGRNGRDVNAAVLLLALQATTLRVRAGGPFSTIGEALARARSGDTIRVAPGMYHEHLTVERPVALLGEPGAVVTGDGVGVVLRIEAPATVRGLTIRGSGGRLDAENAGIVAVRVDGLAIEDNRLEDVLFGIILKQCGSALIRGNTIEGKNLAPRFRGDGIHLWSSHDGRIVNNQVRRTRDVAVWFSDRTVVTGNTVADGRYGLHFMNSRHNRFEANRFVGNDVGAFIMYSQDILFRGNVFANADGAVGRGLGFKDADRITAEHNVIVGNTIGIWLDNSPSGIGVVNTFANNVVAYNDVGVALLPSVRSNVFRENEFRDNVQPVRVSGGGTALANEWRGNWWSEYVGFDREPDGVGDTPFVLERLSDELFARHQALQVFSLSPAAELLNGLSRVLPLLKPTPVVVDSAPR
ncbi:MAG: nitrous oxide reductase family maturation protein NosD, partial [Gemmatimonadetes bacterium]|nr:nitrous oxide reductase family maturation protein NosD [Gemmatimonadota bacterium]